MFDSLDPELAPEAARLEAEERAGIQEDTIGRLGTRDPQSGRLILSPRRTLPTAEAYVREFHWYPDGRTLHAYHGTLMQWQGNHYVEVEDVAIKQRLQPWLHEALRHKVDPRTGATTLVDFEANPTTVSHALESIKTLVHLSNLEPPVWLDGRAGLPAHELIPCLTKTLHVPSGRILPATPALFTTNALDFDYDPQPRSPDRWWEFLHQIFEDDESVELLQEWFGYVLTADTSLQKILLVVGPRRSGKGTLGRVLARLVGTGNVVNPTTNSLAGNFGLQPLIGKSLAVVSDARFIGDSTPIVVERLLNISGEDRITIDRKFMPSVSMKLPTRFVFLTNELPRLSDASTALAGRFLVLRLTRTFYGDEDPTLTNQLLEELPGILPWAIDGQRRLFERGRFLQPESAMEAIRELEDLASPVGAFIRDRCIVAAGRRVDIDVLYGAWQDWCQREGRKPGTKQTFGKDLAAAAAGVKRRRHTDNEPFYEGIDLRCAQ
jgi:putative DNA primase/helicase